MISPAAVVSKVTRGCGYYKAVKCAGQQGPLEGQGPAEILALQLARWVTPLPVYMGTAVVPPHSIAVWVQTHVQSAQNRVAA